MTDLQIKTSKGRWAVALTIWFAAVIACFAALAHYSYQPGDAGLPPMLSRTSLLVSIPKGHHLLVMGLHPQCPCSRASLAELERLIARCEGQLQCVVLAYQPRTAGSWEDSSTVEFAKHLPDTKVVTDFDGQLAEQFKIHTSGGVVLYSPHGEPEFHGGITSARGHEGDNVGSESIVGWVFGRSLRYQSSPVFGCGLQDKGAGMDQVASSNERESLP
jgi:hypothetical protein